jgi:chromosome segregation ATPase
MTDNNSPLNDDVMTSDDLAAQALAASSQDALPAGDDELTLPAGSSVTGQKVGETLQALQNVIERNVSELDRLNEQLKSFKDSMRNVLDNDETLTEAEEKVSLLSQKVKERKSQLNASPEINQFKANITEITERKKEIVEALNTHLLNLYQMTGAKTFDTSTGETREFEIRANVKSGKKAA